MLRELHISNLAVIEDVSLELGEGFNCFTGQTGAGKSLILGAFEILLGLKQANAELLRPDSEEARVSGLFEVHDEHAAEEVSRIVDDEISIGEQLLITRKIFASGRSSHSVNGRPATAGMVRALGQQLVDIHGQHDHQYLLKPSNQLAILDRFADAVDLRRQYAKAHGELRDLIERRNSLEQSDALRRQQLELYEFQAQEIDAAEPTEGEYEELDARFRVMSNLGKIQTDAGQAYEALYNGDGSVIERLQMIVHVLNDLAEMDEELAETAEQIRQSTLAMQEGAFDLGRYLDRLESDPSELAEIEDRLNTLNRLASKYSNRQTGDDPVACILSYREEIQKQIDQLRADENDLVQMDEQAEALRSQIQTVGNKLSRKRRKAGEKLKPLIEEQLKDLGMSEAAFEMQWEPVESEEEEVPGGASGLESLEMLVRTNPGQPARPLRKIASGGEMSRIMLALKSILAGSDRISVLVFDEIDANIGGRMGTVIGHKLRNLAHSRNDGSTHQVLCITHLPQIAAFARRHLRIAKKIEGKGKSRRTCTVVSPLDGESRVDELAEMLAGKDATKTTRKQVKEMLAAAQ